MEILDRLPTSDRLQRLRLGVDQQCLLCGDGIESRDHLFSKCAHSKQIWSSILQMCSIERDALVWNAELQWLCANLKGKSLLVFSLKLAWSTFVYHVWEERNRRKFCSVARSGDSLLHCIREDVKIRVQIKPIVILDVNRQLCVAWGIP
ncbi:hypothetical protein GQ457_08G037540 [Hibiscus cannabinus]